MKSKNACFLTLLLLFVTALPCYGQFSYENPEDNDFLLNVIYNPHMSLGAFIEVGLSTRNTSLRPKEAYRHPKILQILESHNFDLDKSYDKVKAAWHIFEEICKYDRKYLNAILHEPYKDDIFALRVHNPALKKKMNIIPLKQ